MDSRRIFFVISLSISMFCLTAGYSIAGQWIGVAISIFTGVGWLLAQKYSASWLSLVCLLTSVCLAVIGTLSGHQALLMIFGAGTALAVWDILSLDASLRSTPSDAQTRQYEISHLQSLTLALGFGLVMVFFGRSLQLQFPFSLLVFLVILVVFGLDRAWGHIKKSM